MAKKVETEQEEPLEKKRWKTAGKLRKNMDAAKYIDSSNVNWNNEGSFLNDAHLGLKADYIIANPPFNESDWSGELLQTDGRWQYGTTLIQKIKTNTQQIRTLTGVRDTLLLEVVSGEGRVGY